MNKVILFDLYDTILKDISFDFKAGLNYLYHSFFVNACSLKEFTDYATTFNPMYDKRKTDNSEVNLMKDEILLYFDKFAIQMPKDLCQLEFDIMNQMQKETIMGEVIYTLEVLKQRKIHMYILSNSIFSGAVAKKLLGSFGIREYFEDVFSSADFGIRKPACDFYEIALRKIMSDNPGITKDDIIYVGNDYVTDVIGAKSVGLNVVWYNVKHLDNEKNIDAIDIDDFRKILEVAR